MRSLLRIVAAARRRASDEGGIVMVLFALCLLVLLTFCGFAIDLGRWYLEGQRLQNAADAAALSGVANLPGDPAAARSTAQAVTTQNGYTDGVDTVSVQACPGLDSTCPSNITPNQPTQLEVSVAKTVPSMFAQVIGIRNKTITRRSVSEFQQVVNMGSPANVFGNEPVDGPYLGEVAWTNTASFTPNMWANVMGPQSSKGTGDAIQAYLCNGLTSQQNCPSGANADYDSDGYVYAIQVNRSLHANQTLKIQVFDPAAISVGDHCDDDANHIKSAAGKVNSYTNSTDSQFRYRWGDTSNNPGTAAGLACTGDNNGEGQPNAPTTTYVVRRYTSPAGNITDNPVVATGGCAGTQFKGYGENSDGTGTIDLSKALDQSLGAAGGYNATVAAQFRQWVQVCSFVPDSYPSGAYLLQVRTNVALGASQAAMAGNGDPTIVGGGSNRFAIRASWFDSGGNKLSSSANADVSIAGLGNMGLYANANAGDPAPNFYMARVLPGSAGLNLEVRLWDIGDCNGCTSVPVIKFKLANGATTTCSVYWHYPVQYQTLIGNACTFPVSGPTYSGVGDFLTVNIPIPSTYTCNINVATDCWATMTYSTSNGALNDTTTWTAQIVGNPVRLIK